MRELSLSGLEWAAACPGAPNLAANLSEEPSTEPQLRGTAIHLAAQMMVKSGGPELTELELAQVREIFAVTWDDLQDAAEAFFEFMAKKPTPPEGMEVRLLVEHELDVEFLGLKSYVRADGSRSNRLDLAWLVPNHIAIIFEMKFGFSEVTHPKNNRQTKGQAVALAREFGLWAVHTFVFQPQAWHGDKLRDFLLDEDELELAQADLSMRIRRTKDKDAPLREGEQCKWCPAKAVCPARMSRPMIPAPNEMSLGDYIAALKPEERAQRYEQLGVFMEWAGDCRKKFEELAPTHPLLGYGKLQGKGKKEWLDGPKLMKTLKAAEKAAGLKPGALLRPETIGNVEKLLKGKQEALDLLHDFVDKKPGEEKFKKLEAA